jgi:phosphoribosyl 1,2-cyclic phosphodiesterase
MLTFRTLRSGSSGNMLLLESTSDRGASRLIVDCGIRSQRTCRQIFEFEIGATDGFDGLLVTHAHSDHINYPSLRVLEQVGIPIYMHSSTLDEVRRRYLNPAKLPASVSLSGLDLRTFGSEAFKVGDFSVSPIAVPHAPNVSTHAFLIRHGDQKLLLASDFNDPEAVIPHIYDCDLIYLEANYDKDLLRRYYNPASLFHMGNPATGLLLDHAISESSRKPKAIVLGHLSEERNRPDLAMGTINEVLRKSRRLDGVRICAAPRHEPGEPVILAD